jgi:hypothetical protein
LFAEKLRTGGAVVLASAAALTIGRVTVPVYEIYKAGDDPFWMQGLNVLGTIGINAAVIPHYDNREGGDHDTRFCFLGEERLLTLEEQLPPGTFILGIDEHSALMLDLVADIAFVHGRGGVTIRRGGISQTIPATETIPLVALRSAGGDAAPPPARPSADISQNNGTAVAQRLITRERELEAARERERLVEPLIDALLEVRQQARASGDFETADAIRQRLLELGVEIFDSPEGTEYRVGDEAPT